jgi:hypothetical protein
VTDKDGNADRRRERRERLPVDLFGRYRFENGFTWLVISNHCSAPIISHHFAGFGEFQLHRKRWPLTPAATQVGLTGTSVACFCIRTR